MAVDNAPSQSFPVTSGTTAYPLRDNPAGTTTAGSSGFLTSQISSVDGIIVEKSDTAVGSVTISDHAGTAATAIIVQIPATATTVTTASIPFPSNGIAVNWIGIRAVHTGTAQRVRIAFTAV